MQADQNLYEDTSRFISDQGAGSFKELIVRLFERQYRLNLPYRTFCDNAGVTPETSTDWTQIPAIPAKAFKLADLSCVPVNQAKAVFYSSGTTEGNHSKHYMDASAEYLYSQSLSAGFYKFVKQNLDIIALMPHSDQAPNSSLSHMLGSLGAKEYHWNDIEKLKNRLAELIAEGKSVRIFGTAFALLELFDNSENSWKLPSGSIVIETGGFKGRTREITRGELYDLITQRLGVGPESIVAEYGMSEMSSQFYNIGGTGFQSPHWLGHRIIDPVTLQDTETGLLRVYDLANWNSVAVIQTQDTVRRLPNGRFELLGRATDAELRGCSLMVEERWISESAK